MDLNLAREISVSAVREAGVLLMNNFDKIKKASFKENGAIVTETDIKSEKIILDRIKKYFPEHSILSEEEGFTDKNSDYMWTLDPLDGTMNYYHASTPFRIGLCLLKNKKPILSIIHDPAGGHLYYAELGKGAFKNNQKIRVSKNIHLEKAIVMTHISAKREARARTLLALGTIFSKTLYLRAIGSGLAVMSEIADSKFDIFFNMDSSPWDLLPGALLIQEAGGKVTDLNGEDITYNSTSVLATNGKLHKNMLVLLEGV